MTRLRVLVTGAMALGLLLPAAPSFALEFDGKPCREFTGTLTHLDWQNPHSHFSVDIKRSEPAEK